MSSWYKLKDKLPNNLEEVLVCLKNNEDEICYAVLVFIDNFKIKIKKEDVTLQDTYVFCSIENYGSYVNNKDILFWCYFPTLPEKE